MKTLKGIANTLLWVWQAPQNTIGAVYYNWFGGDRVYCKDFIRAKIVKKHMGSITLGNYIILQKQAHLQHELGHTIQSKLFGPLYLLIVGLPSIISAGVKPIDHKNTWYEKWATSLGKKYFSKY